MRRFTCSEGRLAIGARGRECGYYFAMQSKAATVAEYIASLPDDRKAAIEAVRKVILKNLGKGYAEGMTYGMIGYFVPHSVYPAGYHCDPKMPLGFAGLASQKNYMSLYIMPLYMSGDGGQEPELLEWFRGAWAKTGKTLDMGKACIRFKRLEDLPLDVIGEAIRRVPAELYIQQYEAALAASRSKVANKVASKGASKVASNRSGEVKADHNAAKPAVKKATPSMGASKPTGKASGQASGKPMKLAAKVSTGIGKPQVASVKKKAR